MVDHMKKRGFVIGDLLILNQTNVLSVVFTRRLRKEKRSREKISSEVGLLFGRVIHIFVLLRTEDNGVRSEDLLSLDSFQPLNLRSRLSRLNSAMQGSWLTEFHAGVLRITAEELQFL